MKAICAILFSVCLLFSGNVSSQTVFWTENFNNNCAAGCLANGYTSTNGTWASSSLATAPGNGDEPNVWYISCAENGHTNTICGSGCVAASATATRASLHVGASPGTYGDIGAAYDAGGWCGILWCINTHIKIQSPNISTVGYTGIKINFDYIEFGETTQDDMYALQYSTNGGSTWTTLVNPGKTTCCGGACTGTQQGRWTSFVSATLPVAAEGIANLRVAFIWKNNDDMLGYDPSFAVDNLTLTCTGGVNCVPLPVDLIEFDVKDTEEGRFASWKTASETNADKFVLERSVDGIYFDATATLPAKGNSGTMSHYSYTDKEVLNGVKIIYYRLAQIDFNGDVKRYPIVAVTAENLMADEFSLIRNENTLDVLFRNIPEDNFCIDIFSITGTKISNTCFEKQETDRVQLRIDGYSQGFYLVRYTDAQGKSKTERIFL